MFSGQFVFEEPYIHTIKVYYSDTVEPDPPVCRADESRLNTGAQMLV